MADLIIVRPDKCVGCNACVRACPATEANITKILEDGRFITSVNNERCIACGECVKVCNHGAREYIDDTEAAMSRMNSDKLVILASPSIKAVFPTQWKGILDWFKKKGCIIYDIGFGADICSWAHLRAIQNKKVGNIITQPCPAIVKYIETYQPKLLPNLSPIHSPTMCEATYVRKYLRRNNPIAVLSPCIAKKNEIMDTGLIEYNITYKKLMEYFDKNDIRIPTNSAQDLEYPFDDQQGQLGSIYPRPGGLRDNLWAFDPEINVTTSEGVHRIYPELDMYALMPEFKHPEVFDILSCEFGCNIGPASGTNQTVFDVMTTMKEVEKNAKKRRKTSGAFNRGEDKLYKKFDDELRLADFMRNYRPQKPTPVPTDKQLESVYELMGKYTEADRTYNCHACGHKSCREMAISIYRGLNTPENCIVHAKNVLLARHSALQEQHEKLAEITSECLALSDKLKTDVDMITENMSNIGEANSKTHERAGVVNNLLQNVVTFCKGNPTMDAGSVQQLIGILETTIKAFGALDENVTKTAESSQLITESVNQITQLVEQLNETLHKTNESSAKKIETE